MLEWLSEEKINDVYTCFNIGLLQLFKDNVKWTEDDSQTPMLCKSYIENPELQREFVNEVIAGIRDDDDDPGKVIIIPREVTEDVIGKPIDDDYMTLLLVAIVDSSALKNELMKRELTDLDFFKENIHIISFYSSMYSQVLRYIMFTAKTVPEIIDCMQVAATVSDFDDVRELASVIINKEEFPKFTDKERCILLEEIFRLMAVVHIRETERLNKQQPEEDL